MRIAIVANHTPYLRGGADAHIKGLGLALQEAGHDVETLRLPFGFFPPSEVARAMSVARGLNLTALSGQSIDRVISLQFPAYGVTHPHHVAWVMHQHRASYELFQIKDQDSDGTRLKVAVKEFDDFCLTSMSQSGRLFANSKTVAMRLATFNQISAQPLYHPPPDEHSFYCDSQEPYIFYPSRFETLKRQELLIEASQYMRSPLRIVLAGDGGQWDATKQRIIELGVGDRVRILGRISPQEKVLWYANSLAVCYPTKEEDYGYVTLEAMLASKPVVICSDAGGPKEFVVPNETGFCVDPNAQELARVLDWLYSNPIRAAQMGRDGRAHWLGLGVTWQAVIDRLLSV